MRNEGRRSAELTALAAGSAAMIAARRADARRNHARERAREQATINTLRAYRVARHVAEAAPAAHIPPPRAAGAIDDHRWVGGVRRHAEALLQVIQILTSLYILKQEAAS